MNDEKINVLDNWTEEQVDFVRELLSKAAQVDEKTKEYENCALVHKRYGEIGTPIRVDDHKLLFVGARLLPNILNYLVNILPQFIYPYVVAYLQDLSTDEHAITINDLYDLIYYLDNE